MINFVIKKKANGYFFSNPNTGLENEIFEDKLKGIDIILSYLNIKLISVSDGLKYLEEIVSIRDLPVIEKVKSNQLLADIAALAIILLVKTQIAKISLTETEKDLPKLFVLSDSDHIILGSDFISDMFSTKIDAAECLEDLFSKGKVNREEKEKINKQIENSCLLSKIKNLNPELN